MRYFRVYASSDGIYSERFLDKNRLVGTVLRQLFDLSAVKVQKLFDFWVLLCKQFVHQEPGNNIY